MCVCVLSSNQSRTIVSEAVLKCETYRTFLHVPSFLNLILFGGGSVDFFGFFLKFFLHLRFYDS